MPRGHRRRTVVAPEVIAGRGSAVRIASHRPLLLRASDFSFRLDAKGGGVTRRHAEGLEGQWLSPGEVAELDFFKTNRRAKLKLTTLLGSPPDAKEPVIKAVVRREYAAGDVIC